MSYKSCIRNSIRHAYDIFQFIVGNKTLWFDFKKGKDIKVSWGGVFANSDFAEKFINLTRGLDDKSISVLTQILARQKKIITSNKRFLDIYTTDEQREFQNQKENLYDNVLQLSENLFAWKSYLLPIKRFDLSTFYYKYGLNEVETIASSKGKTIIDAGGFIGDSALMFEDLEPDKIYTFEPSPDNFELMKKTLNLNGIKNVIAENVALGAEKGVFPLYVSESGSGSGIIKREFVSYTKETKIPVITLDDYVAEHKINNIGLIKADVEGAEPMFLSGAKNTICTQKPILMICIYHNPHDFFEIKPLIESWNLGYRFKIYRPTIATHDMAQGTILIAEIV